MIHAAIALMLSAAVADADTGDLLEEVAVTGYTPVATLAAATITDPVSVTNLPDRSLTLEELFQIIDLHAPQIEIARAGVAEAAGRVISADGFYDTRLTGDYYGRLSGFWNGQSFNAGVSKQLPTWNAKIYGGYRRGTGGFPIYEDEYSTNIGGEFKIGGEVSLLRNRDIDKNRLARLNTLLGVEAAEQDVTLTALRLKVSAAELLADWLFWQTSLAAYKELYSMALARADALERASAAGNIPELTIQENQQLVLSRQSDILDAEAALAALRGALAVFWRDANGDPVLDFNPVVADIPHRNPHREMDFDTLVLESFDTRPELDLLSLEIRQVRNQLGLAINDQQADLTFGYEVSQEIGGGENAREFGSGSRTRAGTDNIVQFKFSLPIGVSLARGQEASYNAKLKSLTAQAELIQDQIKAALAANDSELTIAERKIALAEQEVELTNTLFRAEEKRFTAGLSSFFELNVLERRLGDAQLRLAVAKRAYHFGLINYMSIAGRPWFIDHEPMEQFIP